MAKKIEAYIKLQVPAQDANPSPPVGPALGQHGVNIMEFCKAFNAQTQSLEKSMPVPVVITVYNDRSFTFIMKTPPAAVLLRKAAGIAKGSGEPNTKKVGTVTRDQLEEIARAKEPDLTAADMDAAVRTVADGGALLGPGITRRLIEQFDGFFDLEDVTPAEVAPRLLDLMQEYVTTDIPITFLPELIQIAGTIDFDNVAGSCLLRQAPCDAGND